MVPAPGNARSTNRLFDVADTYARNHGHNGNSSFRASTADAIVIAQRPPRPPPHPHRLPSLQMSIGRCLRSNILQLREAMVKSTEFPAVEGVGFTTQPAGAGVEEAREEGSPIDGETDCTTTVVIYVYPSCACLLSHPLLSYNSQRWRSQEYIFLCVDCNNAIMLFRMVHFPESCRWQVGLRFPQSAWPFCFDGEPDRHKKYPPPPPRGRSVFTLFGRDLCLMHNFFANFRFD